LALPEDWEFGGGELHIKNDAYQFDFTPVERGHNMTLIYSLRILSDHIDAADIRQYKQDYKNISDKISFSLYKNMVPDATPPDAVNSPVPVGTKDWKVCWPAIWLTFF